MHDLWLRSRVPGEVVFTLIVADRKVRHEVGPVRVELVDARALQLGLRQKAVDKQVSIVASNPLDFGQALVSKVVEFFPHLL